MAVKEKPVAHDVTEGRIWEHKFNTFYAKVFVPNADSIAKVINFGYDAPYFVVLCDNLLNDRDAILTAQKLGLQKIATNFATSVVFINPINEGGWDKTTIETFKEIITNTKIHQYYEDGIAILNNRFFNTNDGFAIRGAIFRSCIIACGKAADYCATNLLQTIEGDGLWGKADIAPTICVLQNLSVTPKFKRSDMPIVSINNSEQINSFIQNNTKHFYKLDTTANNELPDLTDAFNLFIKQFIRWGWHGELSIEDDLEKIGLEEKPYVTTLKTSSDNNGDDANTQSHDVGYICYYKKNLFANKKPVPLLLCFHGGGDSAKHIAKVSNWKKVCYDHYFLLVCVENHMNSTATEMMDLLEILKSQFLIDQTRIYATGFSMGGCKTWDLYQEYPDVFAGLAPMDATFDVGKNFHGKDSVGLHKTGTINQNILVPIFYSGGEETPLPELPFQEKKCFDRMEYVLKVNNCICTYAKANVTFENKDTWQNKIWAINGNKKESFIDTSRNATLTVEYFTSEDANTYTAFSSVSGQGHECRYHTCENAWNFISQFARVDGRIIMNN